MKSNVKDIALLITGGWFVFSLALLAYVFVQRDAAQVGVEPAADPDLAKLLYRYHPERLSQSWEEALIRDYFEDREEGFFVDVGASHYKDRSTTHYLDVALGWEGIAIDPLIEYAADYQAHRPRTRYLPFFVGEESDRDVDMYVVPSNKRLSSGSKQSLDDRGLRYENRKVKTASLTDLLDAHAVDRIDLLKMDIELWEPAALRGFDIERFQPKLVVIEDHEPVRDQIHEYFANHGYLLVERYTTWDGRNAYFVPGEDLPAFLARKSVDQRWRAKQQAVHKGPGEGPPAT